MNTIDPSDFRNTSCNQGVSATVSGAAFGHRAYGPAEASIVGANLNKQLGPEYISQRQGPGGTKLNYLEGWKAVDLANEIFGRRGRFQRNPGLSITRLPGFNGWANSIMDTAIDYVRVHWSNYANWSQSLNVFPQVDQENGKWSTGISINLRVTLKDGTYHEVRACR
ncbi:DNA repair protein rad52 [Thoreauomyces humboldtii]|nr:DNA repair protein rad52 [Thoreauomyces humboldtii]